MITIAQRFNHFLTRFGVRISRSHVRKLPLLRPGVVQAKVGSATLAMPAESSIPLEYTANPDYGSQIGRLAGHLKATSGEYLAIDVGANVGDTLSIIRQAADVPVLCVEGDPQCVGLFKENAAQYDRVELLESFLSDKEGIETVHMDKEGWNTTLLPGSGEGGKTLQFRTLDSVTSGRSHSCGLLKLDVEGYEWKILSGSRMLLENDQPVICLEYNIRHSGFPPEDFVRGIENLRNLGYEHVMVYESQGVLLSTIALGAGWEDFLDMHHFLVNALSPVLYADIVLFPRSKTASFEGFLESERKYCRSRPRLNGSQALS